MGRTRRKRALYEVISKTKLRPGYGRAVEKLHPEKSGESEPSAEKSAASMPDWVSQWRKKPRIVQFNAGRIEVSMPYQLAIALLLGVILLVLIAFRVGEYSGRTKQTLPANALKTVQSAKGTAPGLTGKKSEATSTAAKGTDVSARAKGNHRIVIKQYHRSRDLEHVQRYFLTYGIETVIQKRGHQYFLVTKNTYNNPKKAGTDGAAAKKRIIEIGAGYKAPQGYESFAPRLFSDAYGEKIKK